MRQPLPQPAAARRRVLAAGLTVLATYALLAAASGRISPFARAPMLDGQGPAQAYRWVNPPPDLAPTNVKPSEGVFTLQLGPNGLLGLVLITSDNQVTIVVGDGAVAPHPPDRSVKFLVTPVDPATLSRPPGAGVVTFGNAYRVSAVYEPSGTPVKALAKPIDVILAHPVTATLKPTVLDIYSSPDGTSWEKQDSHDSSVAQQVEAPNITAFGYMQVAGVPAPVPLPATSSGGNGHTLTIALIVAAVCALLVGVGLVLRSRGSG
jgi:hypothetical protein